MFSRSRWSLKEERDNIMDPWVQSRKPLPIITLSGDNATLQGLGLFDEEHISHSVIMSWTSSPRLPRKGTSESLHDDSVTPGHRFSSRLRVTFVENSVCRQPKDLFL